MTWSLELYGSLKGSFCHRVLVELKYRVPQMDLKFMLVSIEGPALHGHRRIPVSM